MASTYSDLKIELIGTGEQSGTWGITTNTNLGNGALGEAITGSATVDFATAADVTITLTNVNTTQSARNLRLNITESSTGVGYVGNLILGSGCQIEKFYLINNTGTGAKTVKNTSGTGIAVPAGKTMFVFNNGTNVVDAVTHATTLTLGSALPIASGGTGSTSTTYVNLASNVTGTLPIANGGTGTTSTTFTNLTTNVTGTLPIANGGTGSTSTTYVNLTSNVTGTLPVGNGGTGITSLGTGVATWLGTPSSANLASAVTDETGSGSLVFATLPTFGGTGVRFSGSTSGTTTVLSGATAGTSVLTLPVATDTLVGKATTDTLTNKRVTPRVSTTASSATPTINTDNTDQFGLTAQAVDITSFTSNLSGTPTDGQKLWIYIVGTAARAITFGASFEASTVALPTTTVTTNRLDVGFVWNAATSKWRCVAVA